jgi:hypothetical protein
MRRRSSREKIGGTGKGGYGRGDSTRRNYCSSTILLGYLRSNTNS